MAGIRNIVQLDLFFGWGGTSDQHQTQHYKYLCVHANVGLIINLISDFPIVRVFILNYFYFICPWKVG